MNGMDALPYTDLVDPEEIDLLLVSQYVLHPITGKRLIHELLKVFIQCSCKFANSWTQVFCFWLYKLCEGVTVILISPL